MAERIQKLIAARGVCSRRKAEALIRQGLVCKNGEPVQLGDTAEDGDQITVDGQLLADSVPCVTLLLYKPRGYVTTASDEQGRRTVTELVPSHVRLFPVGRLDLNSEGLLLMTNDGALANRLMHPSHSVDKVYEVWVNGYHPDARQLLLRPIVLDGRPIRPPKVRVLHENGRTAKLSVTIHEGRNRQVRRMCEQAGLRVTRLKRVAEGALQLGDLTPGAYRTLTAQELAYLNSIR